MLTGVSGLSWGLLSILFFFVLPTISSVADPVPANEDNRSICPQYHRLTVMKDVSYTETYDTWEYGYFTRKTRTNYRLQQVTKWEKIEACCPGYEPHQLHADAESCVPVCPSDCLNGTCHRPNECKCDPGYFVAINKSTGFSECQPNCTSGCHGGNCIEPETCSCDDGYIPAEDKKSCQAFCNVGLENCGENATCIAPDTCKCDNGYAAFTNETGDEERTMWAWFSTEQPTLPITFNSSNVICKPQCEPKCEENAHCFAPNKCQCGNGYITAFSTNKTIKCLPVCKQLCRNSFCSRPNICSCNEGYTPHDWLGHDFCEPLCKDNCINGKCTRPNHCECAVGYEKLVIGSRPEQIVSKNVCVPVCPGNCSNGRCVAPGHCHCNQGYVFRAMGNQTDLGSTNTDKVSISIELKSRGSCEPNCAPECLNGYFCIAPNQCQIQYNDEKILNGFPKIQTRMVNEIDDCGTGQILTENGGRVCLYKLNDTNCYEPNLCAVIMVDHQEMIKNFTSMRRIISVINGTNESDFKINSSENDQTFNWRMPRCTKECRTFVTSAGFSKIVHEDEIIDCYELKLRNESTGIFLRPTASPSRIHQKGFRRLGGVWISYPAICFLKDHFTSVTVTSMKKEDVVESNAHVVVIGIIGTIFTLAFIIGLGGILYRGRQKLSRLRHFRVVSVTNDPAMDGSMARFSTEENS